LHLLTGIFALYAGIVSARLAGMFFRNFGILYVLVAILGLYYGDHPIFGVIANNMADVKLHAVLGTIALILGFGCTGKKCS
jgi:hypothetical protein